MKKDLGKKIISKIKQEKIKPEPRWKFLVKNYAIWISGILSILIGGLAFSVIMFLVLNNDWDVYNYINDSFLAFILLTLPYIWIILLGLFVVSAHYNIIHTKKGYKYKLPTVVISVVFISMFLGVLFYNIGFGQAIDETLCYSMPTYKQYVNKRVDYWNVPEEGRIMGMVIGVEENKDFKLIDLDHQSWLILTDTMQHPAVIEPRMQIRIIGIKSGTSTFSAHIIKPFHPRPPMLPEHFPEIKRMFKLNNELRKEIDKKILESIEKDREFIRKKILERN